MSGKSKSGQNCAFVEYELPDEASQQHLRRLNLAANLALIQSCKAETAIQTLHEKYEIKPGHFLKHDP